MLATESWLRMKVEEVSKDSKDEQLEDGVGFLWVMGSGDDDGGVVEKFLSIQHF